MNRILELVATYAVTISIGFFGCLVACEFLELRERVEALEQQSEQGFEIIIDPSMFGEPTPAPPPPPPGVRICPEPQRKSC